MRELFLSHKFSENFNDMRKTYYTIILLITFSIFIYSYQKSVRNIVKYYNDLIFLPILLYENGIKQISIIMPIYNRLNYLNDTLNSAISQNISISNGIEIICIDDCSIEPTSRLILNKMKHNPNIKLIQHFYNQGTFQARKNGIYFSTGKFIISLDSDDFFYPNSIEKLYQFSKQVDADVIDFVAQAGKKRRLYTLDWNPCKKNITNNHEIRLNFMNESLGFNIWKIMVKRTIFIQALNYISPFFENKRILYAEDEALLGGIFLFSSNFYCTKIPVYIHYMFTYFSVQKGAVQPKLQNRYQLLFVKDVMKYLYEEKSKTPNDANLKDMLSKDPNRTVLYNQLNNINRRIIKKCDFADSEFIVFDNHQNGFCLIVKK